MSITIRPVEGRRERNRFIELPYRLRRGDPQWVPPLRFERRQFLNPSHNPYFQHADVQLFVAERDGEVVGRISAQVDERWDEFQGGRDGMFGFFDCENDPEIAAALFDAAAAWLRARGRERMLGPMDFTTNDECGLLVDGYDEPSLILEPWHPPYYRELIEGVGMSKAMDLLMWELWLGTLREGNQFHEFIEDAAEKSRTEHGVVIRKVAKRNLEADMGPFMEVYNQAWGANWGFVPITDAEVKAQAKNLRPVLSEEWCMIAERKGEVIGAGLTLPDINQVLRRMNGRLLPLGWWHFLTGRRKIDRVRVFALGVKPQYQHMGVAAALYVEHREAAARMPQKGGHMGWILETNDAMNRAMEGMGGKVVQRYRIFERPLGGSATVPGDAANSGNPVAGAPPAAD